MAGTVAAPSFPAMRTQPILVLTTIATAALVMFAPTSATPLPPPPDTARWVADGGPDPRTAAPADVARWFAGLDDATQRALGERHPRVVGNLDGAPLALRFAANGAGRLAYDPRGDGRIAEVVGDLSTADRIAVLVPGVDTTQWTFHNGLGGVRRRAPVWQAAQVYQASRPGVAVVAWLGYDPPEGVRGAAIRADRAATGALALRRFVAGLVAQRPGASIVLIGHSYGALVLGLAAPFLDPAVTDLLAVGSPGMGVRRATDLRTGARVWAGTAPNDWTRWVPGVRIGGAGHGTRPSAPSFGALPLPAGDVDGHDGYFVPGTACLSAIASIVAGDGRYL
jgi:Alpha/beta hydrolase